MGFLFLKCFTPLNKFGKGVDTWFCSKDCREPVIWGSSVDNMPVLFVIFTFKYYVFAHLEFCAAWAVDGLLYIMYLVVFAEMSMPHIKCEDKYAHFLNIA